MLLEANINLRMHRAQTRSLRLPSAIGGVSLAGECKCQLIVQLLIFLFQKFRLLRRILGALLTGPDISFGDAGHLALLGIFSLLDQTRLHAKLLVGVTLQ